MKKILLILITFLFVQTAFAQPELWASYGLKLVEKKKRKGLKVEKKDSFWGKQTIFRYGVKKRNGKLLMPVEYEKINIYEDGYIVIRDFEGNHKIFDINQNRFFDSTYTYVGKDYMETRRKVLFQHGVCQVGNWTGKIGLIDANEKVVVPFDYESIGEYREGMTYFIKNHQTGYADTLGNIIVPIEYDWDIGEFQDGMVQVEKRGKIGFYNSKGVLVIPVIYDRKGSNSAFFEDMIALRKNGRFGYVDITGKVRTPFIYQDAGRFSEGLACVKMNNKSGFIDTNGVVIIPFEYDDYIYLPTFLEGKVAVNRKITVDNIAQRKIGFINKNNEKITDFKYERCASTASMRIGNASARVYIASANYEFENGYATVQNEDCKMGLINAQGEEVVPCEYYNVWFTRAGVLMVSDGKKSRVFELEND